MNSKKFSDLSHALMMGSMVAVLIGLLAAVLAWIYIRRERVADLEEMDRRASVIAHQVAYPVQVALQQSDREMGALLGSSLEGYRRLLGLAIYRADGSLVAAGKGVAELADILQKTVSQSLESVFDFTAGWPDYSP